MKNMKNTSAVISALAIVLMMTGCLSDGADGVAGTDGKDGKDGVAGINGKDGVDGKDGVNGVDGKDGKDGASCSASVAGDGSIVISCDDQVVGTLTNGKDGVNGVDGKDGVNGVDGKDGVNGKDGKDAVTTLDDYNAFLLGQRGTGFDVWSYAKDGMRVLNDGITDPENSSGGNWSVYTDAAQNGTSVVALGKSQSVKNGNVAAAYDGVPKVVMDDCDGVCGTFRMGAGYDGEDGVGFAGIRLGVAQVFVNGTDASSWLGVCMEYTAVGSEDMKIWLRLNSVYDEELGWDMPRYLLPQSAEKTVINIPWAVFRQEGYGLKTIENAKVIKKINELEIHAYGPSGKSIDFGLTKIGAYGTCE